ncbi:hypothetical protein BC831DRAFT_474748, partial [Entophlyctis helioformis]
MDSSDALRQVSRQLASAPPGSSDAVRLHLEAARLLLDAGHVRLSLRSVGLAEDQGGEDRLPGFRKLAQQLLHDCEQRLVRLRAASSTRGPVHASSETPPGHGSDNVQTHHRKRQATAASVASTATVSSTSSIFSLPAEILCLVASRLPVTMLARLSKTCRTWRRLLQDNPALWSNVDLSHLNGRLVHRDVEWIARRSRQTLQALQLGSVPKLTKTGLSPFGAYKLLSLRFLSLGGNTKIPGSALADFTGRLPSLSRLHLFSLRLLDAASLARMLLRCHSLQEIDISDCIGVTSSAFTHDLSKAQCRLRTVRLAGCPIDDQTAHAIASQWGKTLISVDLERCEHITRQSLIHLAACHQLQAIRLGGTNLGTPTSVAMDDALLIFAEGCQSLASISIPKCPHVTSRGLGHVLQFCANLETIEFPSCANIDDEFLRSLVATNASTAAGIKQLNLAGCPRISSAAFSELAPLLHQLVELDMSRSLAPTDAAIETICGVAPHLARISVAACPNVRGAGLVRGIQNIHDAGGSSSLAMDISSNPQISGDAVRYLATLLGRSNVIATLS